MHICEGPLENIYQNGMPKEARKVFNNGEVPSEGKGLDDDEWGGLERSLLPW